MSAPAPAAAPAPTQQPAAAAAAAVTASHDSDSDDAPSLSHDSEGLDEWSDASDDEEEVDAPASCLFCPSVLASPAEVRAHFQSAHAFDFRATAQRMQLDFYQQLQLINFIREKIATGGEKREGGGGQHDAGAQ